MRGTDIHVEKGNGDMHAGIEILRWLVVIRSKSMALLRDSRVSSVRVRSTFRCK